MNQEVGMHTWNGQMKTVCVQIEERCETNNRGIEYEQGKSVRDAYGGFGSEKNFHQDAALNPDR
jgi:hypothetical protein